MAFLSDGLQYQPKCVYTEGMSRFCFCLAVFASAFLFSCTRPAEREHADAGLVPDNGTGAIELRPTPAQAVAPVAVLQAGEFPLWFQFTEEGPTLIETIEAARYSAALIHWPHAPHARFMLAGEGDIVMAVNRDGFIRLSPWQAPGTNSAADSGTRGIGLYRIAGCELWRQYTVGAFVRPEPDANPVALLYRNEWFVYQDIPPPSPRLWTLDARSAVPIAGSLPALDAFAPEDGWDLNFLRRGGSGYWYFRASRRAAANQDLLMFRTERLDGEGQRILMGQFQNAVRPEPLSAAPPALMEMLAAVFSQTGAGLADVISPEFPDSRSFAANTAGVETGGPPVRAFFSGGLSGEAFLVAAPPEGDALYLEAGTFNVRRFPMPALPEGFVYTGIGVAGDTLFATWEEQVGFSIGAAGFMALRPPGFRER